MCGHTPISHMQTSTGDDVPGPQVSTENTVAYGQTVQQVSLQVNVAYGETAPQISTVSNAAYGQSTGQVSMEDNVAYTATPNSSDFTMNEHLYDYIHV